jgi:hypothetical protein
MDFSQSVARCSHVGFFNIMARSACSGFWAAVAQSQCLLSSKNSGITYLAITSRGHHMKLHQYLLENKITSERFARKVRVSGSSVSKWRAGYRKRPRDEHIKRIAKATGNKVQYADWE